MIICNTGKDNTVHLRWRDENGTRVQKKVTDFRPYFFIKHISSRPKYYEINTYLHGKKVSLDIPFEYEDGPWINKNKEPLTKVYVKKASDIPSARKLWSNTYEANIKFNHRYCIDELTEIPEYNLRKWYWDMEWMTTGEYEGAITTIAVYDNYLEKFFLYYWLPQENAPYIADEKTNSLFYDNEKDMLEAFVKSIEEQDPDLLMAWWGLKADIPKLLERLFYNGIDVARLSPIKKVKGYTDKLNKKIYTNYSNIEQPIHGRLCLNLDFAFERLWNDAQKGTLPSLTLEYVSNRLFGEGKKKDSKFTDKNEFFRRAWQEDTQNYLEYNVQDVDLIRRIDEEMGVSEGVLALQKLLIAPFDACFFVTHMAGIYFMRNSDWKAPTPNYDQESEKYDGAMIYDPSSENTQGLHLNVAALDFAGLYPSMILARNISWETKSKSESEFAVNLKTPRDFSPVVEKDMVYYKTDKLGLLPTSVLELKVLRDEYKGRMKKAREEGNKQEETKWNNMQMAVKRLMASFYGAMAFPKFAWYDLDLAASITASAREAIREAAFYVKNKNKRGKRTAFFGMD